MKKLLIVLLIFSMFAFVVAPDAPDIGIGGTDVEKIGELQDDLSPLDNEGKVNFTKYKPFKSNNKNQYIQIVL